jgi:hypothetical protein
MLTYCDCFSNLVAMRIHYYFMNRQTTEKEKKFYLRIHQKMDLFLLWVKMIDRQRQIFYEKN